MSGKPLSDDEASKEMKKMVAFIMQEAAEKAREIQVKADEEFNIEKAKLVQQETQAIEQQYERRLKQAKVRRRIAESAQVNKSRLRVLQARDQMLEEILEETRQRLREACQDVARYQELFNVLVLQCLFRLAEDKVMLICREQDKAIAEKAASYAMAEYSKRIPSSSINVKIDQNNHLAADSAGGVIATTLASRIRCDNTLEARMAQAFEAMLPALRVQLLGHSPNRKFFD